MLRKPVDVLFGIDNLTAGRLVLFHPLHKCGIFQVADTNHAVMHSGILAQFAKDNAVLTSAPRIGGSFPIRRFTDGLNGLCGDILYLLQGNAFFDAGNC